MAQLSATLAAGLLAEVIGLRPTMALAPLGGLLGAAILWFSPVRQLIVLPAAPATGLVPVDSLSVALASEREQPPGV